MTTDYTGRSSDICNRCYTASERAYVATDGFLTRIATYLVTADLFGGDF